MMTRVITYRLAYAKGTVTLCALCARRPHESIGTLGAVSHGAHEGRCDSCGARARGIAACAARALVGPDARIERARLALSALAQPMTTLLLAADRRADDAGDGALPSRPVDAQEARDTREAIARVQAAFAVLRSAIG